MQARHYGLILGCLAYFSHIYEAGPTYGSRRLTREVYPEIEPENDGNQSQVCIVGDVVYNVEEIVPAEQPCLKCRCQPPSVTCEATRCGNKKPGCKAVHRPNQCCPDYECECEYKGRKYSNGERLQASPGEECKVCYCRGGEIQCTDVSCYVRNDCEGKQVPGQCCPKYDHCPTRDSLMNSITEGFVSTSKEPELNNGIQGLTVQNPKITIQEIIPDVKEIPMTQNPKIETEGSLFIEDKTNDLIVTDPEAESSEIAEVVQNAPPVIQIGKDLVFLKKNNVSNYVTLAGLEGLQKGENEDVESSTTNVEFEDKNDLTSASSSHILSLVKKKKKYTVTTTTVPVTQVSVEVSSEAASSTTEIIEVSTNSTATLETLDFNSTNGTNSTDASDDQKVLEIEIEQNPAYPTLPDIINSYADENWMKIDTENDTNQNVNKKSKILQEILEVRSNKTVPSNTTHSWLKTGKRSDDFVPLINLNAALPPEILNAPAESDNFGDDEDSNVTISTIIPEELINSTNVDKNNTKEDLISEKSVETMENLGEYSGEKTTPSNRIAMAQNSGENASVEDLKEDSEVNDMLFVKEYTIDLSNDEESNQTKNAQNSDVEIINVSELEKNATVPEKLTTRNIGKRENKAQSEDDAVFAQLNQELGLGSTEKPKTEEEEETEARKIFQELLEETSTPKSRDIGTQTKESEALEKVSQALAKLVLRGSQPFDAGVLKVLGEFFSSQYKAYESKTP